MGRGVPGERFVHVVSSLRFRDPCRYGLYPLRRRRGVVHAPSTLRPPIRRVALSSNVLALNAGSESALAAFQVIRRNGAVVAFDPEKISVAMTKAFLAVEGSQSAASSRVREVVAIVRYSVVL